ncbi:MAG: hypothetical protein H6Q90_3096 [Deltaproteobacteria bacterium]|nr:hypothetical protein [Deltaproteobacteria bacterium]
MRSRDLGLAMLCVAACSVPEVHYREFETVLELPAVPNRDLDLLFVIDNSAAMDPKQQSFATDFPKFLEQLRAGEDELPNLHLGVVSTDMGTSGSGPANPAPPIGSIGNGGCANFGDDGKLLVGMSPVTGTFLSDTRQPDGTRLTNYTGDLATVFGQMVRLGSRGCGFEQSLAAMRAALQPAANPGFLRPTALLGVVFLTDEDDCSVKDPAILGPADMLFGPLASFRCTRFGVTCEVDGQDPAAMNAVGVKDRCTASATSMFVDDVVGFHAFLAGLKPDPRNVFVGGIVGDPQPVAIELDIPPQGGAPVPTLTHSCSFNRAGALEVADPAVRMKAFFDLFPDRSAFSSICQSDLTGPFQQLGQLVLRTVGNPCVTVPVVDIDPDQPGPQVDCVVEDLLGGTAIPIEPCGPDPTSPCWRLQPNLTICPAADHLKLSVERAEPVDPATATRMRCRLL